LIGQAEQTLRIRIEHAGANQARTERTRQSDLVNFEESAQGKQGDELPHVARRGQPVEAGSDQGDLLHGFRLLGRVARYVDGFNQRI
jgi:hypothetical protein